MQLSESSCYLSTQGGVPKWLRERSAKPRCSGSNPLAASKLSSISLRIPSPRPLRTKKTFRFPTSRRRRYCEIPSRRLWKVVTRPNIGIEEALDLRVQCLEHRQERVNKSYPLASLYTRATTSRATCAYLSARARAFSMYFPSRYCTESTLDQCEPGRFQMS